MQLSGKKVLLTGASRGIGAATAMELAARGAHAILTGRNTDALAELEARIVANGGKVDVITADLASADGVAELVGKVTGITDTLDIAIINAAFAPARIGVPDIDPEELATAMAVNVLATQSLIAALHPLLGNSPRGVMIGMTSAAAQGIYPGFAAYSASKAAFDVILHTYAVENGADSSIRTALIAPGPTRTEMRAEGFPDEDPMTVKPAEFVANAILDFAESDFANDTYLDVQQLYAAQQ